MDGVELALDLERRGAAYYEGLARETRQPLVRELFTMLAEEEREHLGLFQAMADDPAFRPDLPAQRENLETKVSRIFDRLGDSARLAADKVDGLEAALRMEQESYDLYRQEARAAKDDGLRRFFEAVMTQELAHFEAIDNVLAYLKDPGDWYRHDESKRWNWMNS